MSGIDHIFLYSLAFFLLLYFSIKNDKCHTRKEVFKLFIPSALFYALIEALRYDRGVDYLHYKDIYEVGYFEGTQLLFDCLNELLKNIGFSFTGALFVYEIILLCGICFLISSYSLKEGRWMYFFAILSMLVLHENLIRQFVGMPFIFIAVHFMFEKKWSTMIIALLCANLIHSGTIFAFPFIAFSYYFFHLKIKAEIALLLLSVSYYLLNIDVGSLFSEVLQRINFGVLLFSDHLLHYVEESDRWLGADSILEGAQQSIITKSFQFIFECSIIMSSYIALCLRQEQKVQCFYNIMVFAFFMCRLVHGYEILARMFGQLYIYWFIPFGYSLYIFSKNQVALRSKGYLGLMRGCIIIACSYLCLYWGRFIYLNPEAVFIWN